MILLHPKTITGCVTKHYLHFNAPKLPLEYATYLVHQEQLWSRVQQK